MSKFKVGDRVILTGVITDTNSYCPNLPIVVRLDGEESDQVRWFSDGTVKPLAGISVSDDPGVTSPDAANKYARQIYPLKGEPVMVDVYRVLDAFGVTDPAIQHAIKKLLLPGERGAKGAVQDLEEAEFSIRQAIELMEQKGGS